MIVYACDFHLGKAGIETKVRIGTALDLMLKRRMSYYDLFLGAGNFKEDSRSWSAKKIMYSAFKSMLLETGAISKNRSVDVNTKTFILRNRSVLHIHLAKRKAWGSFEETNACIEEMKDLSLYNNSLYVVSSDYHIKRLKFIYKFMPIKKVEFIPVRFNQSNKDKFLEPLRYAKALKQGLTKTFF